MESSFKDQVAIVTGAGSSHGIGFAVLVNNAEMAQQGKQPGSSILENLSFGEWQQQIAMTLNTAFLMTRAVLPVLKRQRCEAHRHLPYHYFT
jgi:NAD(P)-dependent dehydrogenase (short-subunit alcohol dehydrogenase family)